MLMKEGRHMETTRDINVSVAGNDSNRLANGKEYMEKENRIIMLGTGSATVTRCYNTCFVVESGSDRLMVDAGGGNGILGQLSKAGVAIDDIHYLFVTHAHTDHVLGVVWVVRVIMQHVLEKRYDGVLHVYGNGKVVDVITAICGMTLHKKYNALIGSEILFHRLADGDGFQVGTMDVKCFDIHSKKEPQYGFSLRFGNGERLVCMGDEPCSEQTLQHAAGADWMMCEAFCLYADRERFRPYEKFHSTALDAGTMAEKTGVRNLIVYHTEDTDLAHRKERYTEEVKENFSGNVFVPDDLEVIKL